MASTAPGNVFSCGFFTTFSLLLSLLFIETHLFKRQTGHPSTCVSQSAFYASTTVLRHQSHTDFLMDKMKTTPLLVLCFSLLLLQMFPIMVTAGGETAPGTAPGEATTLSPETTTKGSASLPTFTLLPLVLMSVLSIFFRP